jgi:hypothetical protein
MSQPYEPVQYSGPIYLNTVHSITEYQPPTSEMEQRPDVKINPPGKYPKPVVPKIQYPEMDRIPQEKIEKKDGLKQTERQNAFLENSRNGKPLQIHDSGNTYLGNHPGMVSPDISPLFFGGLSVLGLFIVYRAIQNYT